MRQKLKRTVLPQLYDLTRPSTLAATTASEITDEDIGLKPDALSQERAEMFIRAAIAFNLKAAQMREAENRVDAVAETRRAAIQIAADELHINVDLAQCIVAELSRLVASSGEVSSCAVR